MDSIQPNMKDNRNSFDEVKKTRKKHTLTAANINGESKASNYYNHSTTCKLYAYENPKAKKTANISGI